MLNFCHLIENGAKIGQEFCYIRNIHCFRIKLPSAACATQQILGDRMPKFSNKLFAAQLLVEHPSPLIFTGQFSASRCIWLLETSSTWQYLKNLGGILPGTVTSRFFFAKDSKSFGTFTKAFSFTGLIKTIWFIK